MHVVLVPGFFSFDTIGELRYFYGVADQLRAALERLGVEATVHELTTLPTASIRARAAALRQTVAEVTDRDDGDIHFVAHSTGALDVRLILTPTSDLPGDPQTFMLQRVRSVVSVSTPHQGTPLARFLGTATGQVALRGGALLFFQALTQLSLPSKLALKAWRWSSKLDDRLGWRNTIADELAEALGAMNADQTAPVIELLRNIEQDQNLLFQLTEQACDLLNAATANPTNVRCGCVVTRSPRPSMWPLLRFRHDVYSQMAYAIYGVTYFLTAQTEMISASTLHPEQRAALIEAYGTVPEPSHNDGVVPTLSQVWGKVICAEKSDHLDAIGHFGPHLNAQAKGDWLPSVSGFDTHSFNALWRKVAGFIAERDSR